MELNSDWTSDYDKIDNLYDKYYKNEVKHLKFFYLYINSQNELFHIEKQDVCIKKGILDKTQLMYYLVKNRRLNNKSFRPVSILKYNFNMDIDEIELFIDDKISDPNFTLEKSIKDIKWENTIDMFSPLNSLYILFYEKKKPTNVTKRVYISKKKTRKRL